MKPADDNCGHYRGPGNDGEQCRFCSRADLYTPLPASAERPWLRERSFYLPTKRPADKET